MRIASAVGSNCTSVSSSFARIYGNASKALFAVTHQRATSQKNSKTRET
jgi:hypothetical protein